MKSRGHPQARIQTSTSVPGGMRRWSLEDVHSQPTDLLPGEGANNRDGYLPHLRLPSMRSVVTTSANLLLSVHRYVILSVRHQRECFRVNEPVWQCWHRRRRYPCPAKQYVVGCGEKNGTTTPRARKSGEINSELDKDWLCLRHDDTMPRLQSNYWERTWLRVRSAQLVLLDT